jgi:hypothetical protein
MPQFDFYSFFTQTFYILFAFYLFYFVVVYYYLPNLAAIIKFRQKMTSLVTKNINSPKTKAMFDLFVIKFKDSFTFKK